MDKHLLTEIEIKDFKCFKDFKADGFKRVNLIGGKNNVGKTAFMEACYVNVSSSIIDKFAKSIVSLSLVRNVIEYVRQENIKTREYHLEKVEHYNTLSNIHKLEFKINYKDGKKEYYFEIDNKIIIINANEFSFLDRNNLKNEIFLANLNIPNRMLITFYGKIQETHQEASLDKYINNFDENIIGFKIIGGDKPQCETVDGVYRDINEFGDGLKHYISIICALYACENGYLFIDEIDNGIHYTQQDKLWEIILETSKKLHVQVFATTHSKECIESYARVAKKLEDKDTSYIKMTRLNDGSIKAGVRDYDMLQDSMDDNHEVRGW
ncbi:MAG: ATP/GTP-binding protein [Sulfurimonas sp.]|uniref:AAA family ATPase n=1 Tax=Sulfurimonas sp. TaxID=2022749 RepID=UPI003D0E2C77